MSHLFRKHHDARYTHLTGQQDVLTGLGHGTVVGPHHQDRAVHLRRTGDHVLDVVRMARAVHVRIMTGVRLVLHVGRGDRDAALFFLRRLVDLIERNELGHALQPAVLGDRRRQGRLAMIDVTDRPTFTCGLVLSNFSLAIFVLP
jgi:hypothetical protein